MFIFFVLIVSIINLIHWVITPTTISLIRMLYYVDISKITKLDISKEIMKEIEEFINDYYDRYSGIYLKSKTLLDYIEY